MANLPININAEREPDASVRVANSQDISRLSIEAATIELLVELLTGEL